MRVNNLGLELALTIMNKAETLLANQEYNIGSDVILSIVNQSKLSAYDAEFVALAQHLNKKLVTADKQIIRSFPKVAVSCDEFISEM